MASYQSQSGFMGPPTNKITKSRSKAVVKPILKKLSHSEKSSLDLDRGWEEQIHYGVHGWGARSGAEGAAATGAVVGVGGNTASGMPSVGGAGGGGIYEAGRTARDVSFSLSATDLHGGSGRTKFSHTRSTSGTSHVSIATTGSGHGGVRGGSFVHPFQQTPSYANSLASLDNYSLANSNGGGAGNPGGARDYSPTITEYDDDDDDVEPGRGGGYGSGGAASGSAAAGRSNFHLPHAYTHPYPSSLRRPSLNSQRTASLSDISQPPPAAHAHSHAPPPPLRVNTSSSARSIGAPPQPSRLHLSSSRSDLQLNLLSTSLDSPASSTPITAAQTTHPPAQSPQPSVVASPSSSVAPPMSPLRSSLDMAANGFRLRSRSEVDSAARQNEIRQARRKFEEKERVKDEKYEREEIRKRDRAITKEASKWEKQQKQQVAQQRKEATPRNSFSVTRAATNPIPDVRPSVSTNGSRHPSSSSFSAPRRNGGSGGGATPAAGSVLGAAAAGAGGAGGGTMPSSRRTSADLGEKMAFKSSNYNSTLAGQTPARAAEEVAFAPAPPRRSGTAKQKTQSAWTSFILWLKIKILRLGKS